MKKLILLALIAAVAIMSLACDDGQTIVQTGDSTNNGITVTGTGKALGAPDIVLLRLGVQVLQPSVEAARNQAATSMQAVIDSLKGNGVQDKDIQTLGFSVQPQYDFSGRVQTLRGYQVTNTVTATLRKVDQAGKTIDDATRAGGNDVTVQGISFTIDDPKELQSQAREKAVAEAKQKAEALARHAGVSLGRPLSIAESNGSVPQPILAPAARAAADAVTPIQSGELEIVVNVTVVYSID